MARSAGYSHGFGLLAALGMAVAVPGGAHAGAINIEDINPGSSLLNFDAFPNGTFLSIEFAGVLLSSGDTPSLSNSSPFVATESAAGAQQTGSQFGTISKPNKIVGAIGSSLDSVVKCQPCAVVVTFMDPLPTQVGFWVSDPDFGQFAEFSGPIGLLSTLSVTSHDSGTPFFIGFEDANGISQVAMHSVQSFGVGIDDLQFGTPIPEPSTALLVACGLVGLAVRRRRAT